MHINSVIPFLVILRSCYQRVAVYLIGLLICCFWISWVGGMNFAVRGFLFVIYYSL